MAEHLAGRHLALRKIVWERGEATVADVQAALDLERPLAYSTVATVMARMEQKGLLTHREEGRTYIYAPAVTEERVGQSLVGEMVERIFDGSPAALVSHLLETDQVDAAELERIRQLVRRHQTAGRSRSRRKKK